MLKAHRSSICFTKSFVYKITPSLNETRCIAISIWQLLTRNYGNIGLIYPISLKWFPRKMPELLMIMVKRVRRLIGFIPGPEWRRCFTCILRFTNPGFACEPLETSRGIKYLPCLFAIFRGSPNSKTNQPLCINTLPFRVPESIILKISTSISRANNLLL